MAKREAIPMPLVNTLGESGGANKGKNKDIAAN